MILPLLVPESLLSWLSCCMLPLNPHVLAGGLENWHLFFDANERTPGFLTGHSCGTAAHSEIQYRIASVAVRFNDVFHQRQGFCVG